MKIVKEWPRPAFVDNQAGCCKCAWSYSGGWEARKEALAHARKTGHAVYVQWGYVQHYKPESQTSGENDSREK